MQIFSGFELVREQAFPNSTQRRDSTGTSKLALSCCRC